jgi:hypothetical protein
MEIIAKTSTGCLISATSEEVKEILRSVTGKVPDNLEIGQRIPAIDYASTVTKVSQLGKDYCFTNLVNQIEFFNREFLKLQIAITNAASLKI